MKRSGSAGFTLLELLVSMALLSLILLGTASALRSMAQAENRIDNRIEQADIQRGTAQFLSQVLGRVSTRRGPAGPAQPEGEWPFRAEANALTWVGVLPSHHGGGGRQFFRLGLESQSEGAALVVRFQPWEPDTPLLAGGGGESRVLVPNVTGWRMQFLDSRQQPVVWRDDWLLGSHVPAVARLLIVADGRAWPDIVIPLRAMPSGLGNTGQATFGGSSD